jgi:hypothetical protein
MRDEAMAARLALEACRLGIPLDAQAYLAALACVRTPADLSTLVAGMSATPRLRWLRSYADAPVSSVLALAGTLGGTGRSLPALQNATPAEVQAALQALAMIEASVGGVSALLQDLRASGVPVGPASRCMLLSTAMLEGWVQQQLALHVWLPLLAPRGDALLELLGPSLRLVETPTGSGFKGAWCFDWRAPETTHPILIAWMKLRGQTDPRFAPTAADAGLCPVDVGVHVLEGILLSLQHVSPPRAVSAAARTASAAPRTAAAASRTATQPPSGSISGSISGAELPRSPTAALTWRRELSELQLALQAIVVRYEAAANPTGGRGLGFAAPWGAASAPVPTPALASLRGALRDVLVALDLHKGIRFGAQCQTAMVYINALEGIFALLGTEPSMAQAAAAAAAAAGSEPAGAVGFGRRGAVTGARRAAPSKQGKNRAAGTAMTKRERKAVDDLTREGWVHRGAVDPSPQRTTVAVAASLSLLLLDVEMAR